MRRNFLAALIFMFEVTKGEYFMTMIKVENLTFSYPSSYDAIFDNVSFQIDTDW